MSLPEWISTSKDHFLLPRDIDRWHEALQIAWDALDTISKQADDYDFHSIWNPDSGPEVASCKSEDTAKEAMRRIEELGRN